MRIQVGTPSNLQQISVESYKSSVIAALDSVTASVAVAPRIAMHETWALTFEIMKQRT